MKLFLCGNMTSDFKSELLLIKSVVSFSLFLKECYEQQFCYNLH